MDYSHIRDLDLLISLDSVGIIILFLEPSKYYTQIKEKIEYLRTYGHIDVPTYTITIPRNTYDIHYDRKKMHIKKIAEILDRSKKIKLRFYKFLITRHGKLPIIIVNEKEVANFSYLDQSDKINLFVEDILRGSLILDIY